MTTIQGPGDSSWRGRRRDGHERRHLAGPLKPVVVGQYVVRIDVDEFGVFLQVPLREDRGTEDFEVVTLERADLRLVEVQFLRDLEHGDLLLATSSWRAALRQPVPCGSSTVLVA